MTVIGATHAAPVASTSPSSAAGWDDGGPWGGAGRIARCPLPAKAEAAGVARDFTRNTVGRWSLSRALGDVLLVVSELVTNAQRYGLPPHGTGLGVELDTVIRLTLVDQGDGLVCAVRDATGDAPRAGVPDFVAECGRGLFLVDSLASGWGWYPLRGGGKVVWASVSAG